jgi:hypothetical protein
VLRLGIIVRWTGARLSDVMAKFLRGTVRFDGVAGRGC